MDQNLYRSINQPIRQGLSWEELWQGPDKGLIWCWERGRQKQIEAPDLAERAKQGELVILAWTGGIDESVDKDEDKEDSPDKNTGRKKKEKVRKGTLHYLATWQGLRGDDLDIDCSSKRSICCTRTGRSVCFTIV